MAIQYIGTTISGIASDTKPTPTANEKGVIFIETDTNKIYQWDTDSWNQIITSTDVAVGALDSGSITSGFGTIDTGSSNITTTGTVTAGNLDVTGTTTTIDSTNTTIADRLIELANGAGSSTADAGIIVERGSTGDNAVIAWDESVDTWTLGTTTATGASTGDLSITAGTLVANLTGNVTGNTSGTAATVTTAAQGNITSLGTLTALQVDNLNINLNTITATSGAVNITPAAGSAIVLDGTISIDAGVVTGATSITSTAFVGALTGDASGTAATVTGAAQSAITSLGTLTTLQVDYANLNASTLKITDSSDTGDYASLAVTTHGATTLATVDDDATAAHLTLDVDGNIELNADGGTITFADAGSGLGTITSSGYSGNAATATELATARAINGTDFDGTQAITITAAGSTLSDTVTVGKGGTGATTLTANGVLIGNGTSAIASVDMSTKGHILIGDGSGNPQMLAIGTDDYVLTADDSETTGVKWAAAASPAITATANGANNYVATYSASTALNAEANLQFDGTDLNIATGSIEVRTIDYSDGDNAITIADGGGATFAQDVTMTADKSLNFPQGANITFTDAITQDSVDDDDHQGIIMTFTAGSTVTQYSPVYIGTDDEVHECDADAIATMPCIGVSVNTSDVADGNPIEVMLLGLIRNEDFTDFGTNGAPVFVSTTAGSLTNTAPSASADVVQIVGHSIGEKLLFVQPSLTYVVIA